MLVALGGFGALCELSLNSLLRKREQSVKHALLSQEHYTPVSRLSGHAEER